MIERGRIARIAALAAILLSSPALADPLADAVAGLSPSVSDVRIPGPWEEDGRSGLYRVVIARVAVPQPSARLFVQWIERAADGTQSTARSIEIAEIAQLGIDISDIVAEPEDGGLTIFIDVASPAGDAPGSYELLVESDGSYRFGPASN